MIRVCSQCRQLDSLESTMDNSKDPSHQNLVFSTRYIGCTFDEDDCACCCLLIKEWYYQQTGSILIRDQLVCERCDTQFGAKAMLIKLSAALGIEVFCVAESKLNVKSGAFANSTTTLQSRKPAYVSIILLQQTFHHLLRAGAHTLQVTFKNFLVFLLSVSLVTCLMLKSLCCLVLTRLLLTNLTSSPDCSCPIIHFDSGKLF